jgi:hypothetical protein
VTLFTCPKIPSRITGILSIEFTVILIEIPFHDAQGHPIKKS